MDKFTKYKFLRTLPGEIGRRYADKFSARYGGFEEAIRRCAGMTCIDLGANMGDYTRIMALGMRKVVAFEPDPWTYAILQDNVADLDNVTLENAAAATSHGTVFLYRDTRFQENPTLYSQSSSTVPSKTNVTASGAVEVTQIDFISYLEELDEDIGVLKIDIEGAEVDLLEALFDRPHVLERMEYVFAETHEKRIPVQRKRVKALRARARRLNRPYVNLFWH